MYECLSAIVMVNRLREIGVRGDLAATGSNFRSIVLDTLQAALCQCARFYSSSLFTRVKKDHTFLQRPPWLGWIAGAREFDTDQRFQVKTFVFWEWHIDRTLREQGYQSYSDRNALN